MQQQNPFDQFDAQPAPFGNRPVIHSPPPEPKEPKTTYRTLTPEEIAHRRLPPGSYQVSSEGAVTKISDPAKGSDVAEKQVQNASALLKAAGVDIARGIDPIAPLIKGSTSGPIQHIGAEGYGAVTGHATEGMQNIGKLQTIVSDMVLQLTGGGLGNQISNADREFIQQRVGNLADPNIPADQRLAAWQQVKDRMGNILGIKPQASGDDLNAVNDEMRRMFHAGNPVEDIVAYGRAHGVAPNPDQLNEARMRGMDVMFVQPHPSPNGPTTPAPNTPAPNTPPSGGGGVAHSLGVGAGGIAEGVGDFLGLVSNPFIQGVNAIAGTNFRPDMGANVRESLDLPSPQNSGEKMAATISNYGTQAMIPATLARGAAQFVSPVAKTVGAALERFGAAPLTDAAAGASGGAASEGVRQAGGSPLMQTVAGIAGAGLSLPVSGRISSAATATREIPAVVNAGKQEGVAVNRAMVDRNLQQKTTAVGKTMVGGRMMQSKMRQIGGQIEGRVQALGRNGESLSEPSALGGAIQSIGRRYIQASGAEFKKHYGDLARQTEGISVPASEAGAKIDAILSRLNGAPNQNAAEIKYLEGIKADLANGVNIETARDIGSRLSKDISKGDVTFGKSEADVLDIRKALSRDVENGLTAAGKPDVAARYREVDAAYSKRMDFIKQKLQGLLGKRNSPLDPEKTAGRFNAMAGKRGDASGLFQILNKATPEERADIVATFANDLGRTKDGFSSSQLITDLEGMPVAARVALFGKDGAKSLENLRILAAEHKRVSNALGGSPTGVANDYRSFLLNAILGSGAGLATTSGIKGLAVAGGGIAIKTGRDALNAKALMSPKITGWLRSAPRTDNPAAINAHFDRLKALAVREPALAPEIQKLQDLIMRAANENVTPGIAASQPNQGDQGQQ